MTIHEWRTMPPPPRPRVESAVCGFPSGRRHDGLCGRVPIAAYVNTRGPGVAYRCPSHDRDVVVEAAAAKGFQRVAVARG